MLYSFADLLTIKSPQTLLVFKKPSNWKKNACVNQVPEGNNQCYVL